MRKFFPLEKYKYYINGNKVIAVSTYAGRHVRGVAICNPNDEFDLETGKKLAALRCNQKVAEKRMSRAADCVKKSYFKYFAAGHEYDRMLKYFEDAKEDYYKAQTYIDDVIKDMVNKELNK